MRPISEDTCVCTKRKQAKWKRIHQRRRKKNKLRERHGEGGDSELMNSRNVILIPWVINIHNGRSDLACLIRKRNIIPVLHCLWYLFGLRWQIVYWWKCVWVYVFVSVFGSATVVCSTRSLWTNCHDLWQFVLSCYDVKHLFWQSFRWS